MFRTKLTLADVLTVMLVALAAVLVIVLPLFSATQGQALVITTPEGETVYALSETQTVMLTSNGITLEVVIADGGAYVAHSECPDGVCVASGRISHDGETILCAPARVMLKVRGGENGVDFVAG